MTTLLEPAPGVDLDQSIASFGTLSPSYPDLQKDPHDLLRYVAVIEQSRPNVIIELGTHQGFSAVFFADQMLRYGGGRVISYDIDTSTRRALDYLGVTYLWGDSTDPATVAEAAGLVRADNSTPRVMVVLDSDHTAEHVAREIPLWAPLVTPGCYLVIEDGIYHWAPHPEHDWDPLVAISALMPARADFQRDLEVEGRYPITGSPAGWWRRQSGEGS